MDYMSETTPVIQNNSGHNVLALNKQAKDTLIT